MLMSLIKFFKDHRGHSKSSKSWNTTLIKRASYEQQVRRIETLLCETALDATIHIIGDIHIKTK